MRRFSLPTGLAAIALCALLGGCAPTPQRFTQAQSPDQFSACSGARRCVSSQAHNGSSTYVAPFTYAGSTEQARKALLETLRDSNGAKVEQADGDFVHATYRSALFHFVDDVTFIIHPQGNTIDVKSTARIRYYAFGVNRRRVERLRARFETLLNDS